MSSPNALNALNTKSSEVTSSPKLNGAHPSESDKTCVVCFKIVDIFSIGECDHPVCYECSTRMRVLCKQNECPICRRINQKVIFTSEILSYKELDLKNRLCLYDKQYRICFTGQRAQNAFRRLLEHSCNKCNESPFETAAELKDHLRKKHELFYCDLCMEHLKIFSFERRAYTREQLAMHRRKGDLDNTSHRGHPLCEYCDQRYLDRDELFRHLRKEHYYCHFCDADGSNHFYANHKTLQAHFLEQHFLCTEGECKENIFSAVYRTEIDLKAHKATVHGQTSKQARTIDFQFNLAPRNNNRVHQNQDNELINGMNDALAHNSQPTMTQQRIIDAKNEQEFPSLGNAQVTIRPTVALNMRPSTSGLARTKENFPALGGSSLQSKDPFHQLASAPVTNASTLLFRTTAPKPAASSTNDHKNIANNKAKTMPNNANDFPALSGKGKKAQLESDMIESSSSFDLGAVSAKYRQLVNSYESSVSNTLLNQKMKTIQRVETKSTTLVNNKMPLISSKHNFPALGGQTSSSTAVPQWLNATTNSSKNQTQKSKKLKVAPAPILPTSKFTETQNESASKKSKSNEKAKATPLNEKKIDNGKVDNANKKPEKNSKKSDKENAKKIKEISPTNSMNGNKKKSERKINSLPITSINENTDNSNNTLNETINSYSSVANFTLPPPGFPAQKLDKKTTKAPPGFENISKYAKQYSYISPSNALLRNQILMSHFIKSLKSQAVDEFRNISKMFRSDACNARAYYEHCEIVLGERFESIFSELLVLLPDIGKQQELYRTYREKHNQSKSFELNNSIQVCAVCQQVVKRSDFVEHTKYHNEIESDNKLNKNFPKLSIKK